MYLCRLLFIFFLIPVYTFAQQGYQTGYIVNSKSDTVKGYINYRLKGITSRTVEFKSLATDKAAIVYKPSDLREFVIDGSGKFVTYAGRISMDKNKFPDIAPMLDTTTRSDTVFLKVTYAGKYVSFLEYEDALKLRLFVAETGSLPVELIYYQFYSGGQLRSADIFKKTLSSLAHQYNPSNRNLDNEIASSYFSAGSIASVVKHINNDASKERGTFTVSVFAALAYNSITSKATGSTVFNGLSSTYQFPKFSAGVDIADTVALKRFAIRAELSYTQNKLQFSKTEVVGVTTITNIYGYQVDQRIITVAPQLVYNVVYQPKFKLFAAVGLALNYGSYSNNQLTRNNAQQNDPHTFKKVWLSYPINAGVTISRSIDFFATYTLPASIANAVYLAMKSSSYSAGVRYHF